MSVYDRWHLSRAPEGATRCPKHRKYPSREHGVGLQWQVRGTDGEGKPVRRNFATKAEADEFHAKLRAEVRAGTWIDERDGEITLERYARGWLENRVHDPATAQRVLGGFRNHVFEDDDRTRRGRTVKGGQSIGQYPLRVLARRASLLQGWIKSMPLHPNTVLLIITDVSAVFQGAVDDHIITSNPLKAASIQRPDEVKREAIAWTAEQVEAVAAQLPAELELAPYLGAGIGHRPGELRAAAVEDLGPMLRMCHVEYQVKYLNGRVFFAPVKNHDRCPYRDVPIADDLVPLIARHLELYPALKVTLPFMDGAGKVDGTMTRSLIFHNGPTAWYAGTFDYPWNRAVERAAKSAVMPADRNTPHVLRHTAATNWLANGLNLAAVAAYLGDTKETIIHTYSHVLPNDDTRARDIMNAFFRGSRDDKMPGRSLTGE